MSEKYKILPQVYGAAVVSIERIIEGTILAYPTKTLPGLRNETDTSIQLDDNLGSWYAALFWICGIIFAPMGGYLSVGLAEERQFYLLFQ